jgi:SAM-dependent methyltransferase
MKDVNYKLWSGYLLDIIKENIEKHDPAVLELGAGNCKIAEVISTEYPDYIASDLSIVMLKQYIKNNVVKVCCDMTSLPFNKQFDLILSTFDSVNYLLTKKKLFNLFREVRKILSDSGIFTFDVSLERNSLDFDGSFEVEASFNGYHFERKSSYNQSTRIHKNIFKIKDRKGNFQKEIHKQKIYKLNTYFRLIEKAGLFVVECFDAFTFETGTPDCERVQFILKIDKSKC